MQRSPDFRAGFFFPFAIGDADGKRLRTGYWTLVGRFSFVLLRRQKSTPVKVASEKMTRSTAETMTFEMSPSLDRDHSTRSGIRFCREIALKPAPGRDDESWRAIKSPFE